MQVHSQMVCYWHGMVYHFGSPQYKYKCGVNGESGHRKRGLSASNEEILKPFGSKRSNGKSNLTIYNCDVWLRVPERAWRDWEYLGDMNGVNMGLCHSMSLSIVRVITGRVWGHWLKTWYSRKFKGIQFLGEPLGECFIPSLRTGRHWSSQKLWNRTATSFGDSSCRTRKSQRVT